MEVFIIKTKVLSYDTNVKIRICLIISCFIAALFSQSVNFNIPVLIVFFAYCLLLLIENAFFIIKYLIFIMNMGMAVVSVFIIEAKPIYLSELVCNSKYSGALPLFTGFYLTFILTLELADRKYSLLNNTKQLNTNVISFNGKPITGFILDVFGAVLFVITSIMFLRLVMLTKPYFILNIDRFRFRMRYVEGIWKKFEDYYIYFMPIFVINWMRGKKKLTSITILLYILYLLWQGEKYTQFITMMYLILLPFLAELNEDIKRKASKLLIKGGIIIAMLISAVLIQYSFFTNTSVFDAFFKRLAMQGQLWWSIYTRQINQLPHFNEVADELTAFSDAANFNPYYGIYKIMYLCAPSDVVAAKLATGSGYTESTAASIYYYFGKNIGPFILIIFAIIMGLFFAFLTKIYVKFVSEKRIVESVITARLIISFKLLFNASDINAVFGVKTIITIIILLLCVYVRQRRLKNSRISYKRLILNKGR